MFYNLKRFITITEEFSSDFFKKSNQVESPVKKLIS